LKNILVTTLIIISFLSSCKKEDDVEPLRDVQEQSIADDQSIEDFLSSHFYNYEDFSDPDYDGGIVFDTLQNENASKTPLINQVRKEVISVITADGSFIDHNLYYLIAREGTGISPATVDSTYLSYEGLLLDKSVFDSSSTPVWFDLTSVVRGFREGAHKIRSGDFRVNDDNTVDFFGYGQGALFFPSGLGYFSRTAGAVPAYAPLIFKINMYGVNQTDHDGDGILSADEFDNDGDGVPDDTDEDGTPDYLDAD
jgi:hypothetical protein